MLKVKINIEKTEVMQTLVNGQSIEEIYTKG